MEATIPVEKDRAREYTPSKLNARIDKKTAANIEAYVHKSIFEIQDRIKELDREWDVERILELHASTALAAGVVLTATVSRKWIILPALISFFLVQHAVKGWCPPMTAYRKMGVRTKLEIVQEREALVALLEQKVF